MITNRVFGQLRKFNLAYIVGEVLLIFIGITLSFYFDEWRTNRQNRKREVEILGEIFSSVKNDTTRMQILMDLNNMASKKMSFLLDSTRHEKLLSNKSQECFSYLTLYDQFSPDLSAYHNLKNQGLELITNTKLRINMIRYYEEMEEQSDWTNNVSEVHFRLHILPYVIDEFSVYLRGNKAIPENFEKLKNNKRFWKIVQRTQMFDDLTSGQLKARKRLGVQFLNELEKELNQ